jgi:pimeloyl-ACP methyl ester carboxylesterase
MRDDRTPTGEGGAVASRRRHAVTVGVFAVVLALIGGLIGAQEVRLLGDVGAGDSRAAFYAPPSPVPAGAPGDIIRSTELAGTPFASRAWRIMYHSTDLNGADVVVTGILVVPLTPAPPGGRTVVSWGHPTTGSAATCAPSYGFDPYVGIEGLRALLDRGYAVVGTDYAGMGTPGPDSYLIGATEAHNMLDAVRAARAIPATEASDRVILWGHSQGGQAVLRAAELAAGYAPELDIEAVAVAAPAADLSDLMSAHLDDISGVTIGSYAFTAYAGIYGPTMPGAQLDDILTDEAVAAMPKMNALCLLTSIPQLHAIGQPLVGNFFRADPTATEPWKTLLAENSAGSVAFDAPLFIAQGLKDELVIPADTADFAAHETSLGMDVTFEPIPIATHGTVAYLAIPGLMEWLDRTVTRR